MIVNEEKMIRKQLIKNMLYNFLILTIIFILFGILMFHTLQIFVYESSNRELSLIKEKMEEGIKNPMIKKGNKGELEPPKEKRFELAGLQINPRVTYVIRDEEGNIKNTDKIGRIYDEFGGSISFDKTKLDSIYEMAIYNRYYYRGINLKTINEYGETQYIQLLVNVDSEKMIMDNYLRIFMVGIGITIMLSLIASYIISKRALQPIVENWKKQIEFVQNASHELRTPLTIIQTKQELLLQEPNKKIIDQSENIMLTLNEAKRLSKMTKDLMLLARADSEQMGLVKEEVDLDERIKKLVIPYQELANMEEKKLELDLNYQEKSLIDINKIHQVMIILLDNAIKYTKPNDTITIHTKRKEGKCIIEVSDTGIGISEEGLKHAFERFYREDKARSRKTGGTGLGLSIAQYLVALHKGSIKITHNEPKGTSVKIKLPKH
ncbi:MAG: GHKL domain-containing protein [Clostridia bacterium]|nr:GHKL domain-containing protein [Clostridia bacterium]